MKERVDKELVNRLMVPSRSKAQELINSSLVKCNGRLITKCNYMVLEDDILTIENNDKLKYVSRGGLKLDAAINKFNLDFTNLKVMDIGSSTGGFCDCALKHGAKKIVAVDVGTNLLHESLRNNPKIELHEQTNFKSLNHSYFQGIDIITCDVSFISLLKVIEKISNENILVDMVCLIKPQFECGKEIATKYKGIILNKEIHYKILNNTIMEMNKFGFYLKNIASSPIRGGDGNIEYISYISNKVKENCNINLNKIIKNAFNNKEYC